MKLFKVDAPSIHTSLKLILADKKTKKKQRLFDFIQCPLQLSMYRLILKVTASPEGL